MKLLSSVLLLNVFKLALSGDACPPTTFPENVQDLVDEHHQKSECTKGSRGYVGDNSVCDANCKEGYAAVNKTVTLTCKNGTWEFTEPKDFCRDDLLKKTMPITCQLWKKVEADERTSIYEEPNNPSKIYVFMQGHFAATKCTLENTAVHSVLVWKNKHATLTDNIHYYDHMQQRRRHHITSDDITNFWSRERYGHNVISRNEVFKGYKIRTLDEDAPYESIFARNVTIVTMDDLEWLCQDSQMKRLRAN